VFSVQLLGKFMVKMVAIYSYHIILSDTSYKSYS